MKLHFFSTDFRQNVEIFIFLKIRRVGAEVVPCGQADTDGQTERQATHRHDETKRWCSQFCERA